VIKKRSGWNRQFSGVCDIAKPIQAVKYVKENSLLLAILVADLLEIEDSRLTGNLGNL